METVNKPRKPSETKKCIDALFTELEQVIDNDDFQVFKDRFLDILPEHYHNIDHMRIAHFISSLGAYIRKQKIKQEIIQREGTSKSFFE
ncbi:MAG: hypothetical protein C6H99_01065, partial [Epsilonproteobacteria bacterium]|nr:hypothetical protein [Campylobacterota bacterium]NPA63563.1 hypothetical protein [Campylobacterota bacterium]